MLPIHALTTEKPIRSKKYLRNLALAIVTAVAITVILTSSIVNITQANGSSNADWYSQGSYTQKVMSDPIFLNPKGVYFIGFNVPDNAIDVFLQGSYSVVSNGTYANGATMTIWTQEEFLNYWGCRNAVPCYNKDMIPMQSDNLNVTLSKGNYLVMICGNGFETMILETQLTLSFTI
jgi:hypothetical protein